MISLYELPSGLRLFLQLLLMFAVSAQILQIIMSFMLRGSKKAIFRIIFELGLVFQLLILNLSIGIIQINAPQNLMVEPYLNLRSSAIFVPLLSLPLLILEHRSMDVFAAVFSFLLLPHMEAIAGQQYQVLCIMSVLFFFLRSVLQLFMSYRKIRQGLSRFTMKEAFDRFPNGLAIGREHRGILLINKKMREIMAEKGIADDRRSSGLRLSFLRMLKCESLKARQQQDENSFQLSDLAMEVLKQEGGRSKKLRSQRLHTFKIGEKTYLYSEEHFQRGRKSYRQMLVNDISLETELLLEIQKQNKQLTQSNAQLELLLENIEAVETEKESARMRNRIHDVMGQRLSILHSTLRQLDQNQKPQVDELLLLLNDLLSDLREPDRIDAELRLKHITNAAEIVGTKVEAKGRLPEDPDVSAVFLQVLREAVTNAIRHGQAKYVSVHFQEMSNAWQMDIVNDGAVPRQKLSEGEGISGMRRKLAAVGGELHIKSDQEFSMQALIPKKFS